MTSFIVIPLLPVILKTNNVVLLSSMHTYIRTLNVSMLSLTKCAASSCHIAYPIRSPVINVHKCVINVAPSQIHYAVIVGVIVEMTTKLVTLPREFFFDTLDDQLTLTNNDTFSSEAKHLRGHNQEKVGIGLALDCIVVYQYIDHGRKG